MTKKPSPTQSNLYNPSFQLRPVQKAALPLLRNGKGYEDVENVLLAGGGRSGKSFLILLVIILRCIEYPNSRHAVFKRTRASCEATVFNITLDQVLNALHNDMRKNLVVNKSDMIVTFKNGSVITFDGLDEHRREKVLGAEWQTIWMNECNEFDYEDVEVLSTRLNGDAIGKTTKLPIRRKMIFDCNPRTKKDWDYKLFVEKVSPLTNKPLEDAETYDWIQVNNDDPAYLKRFANSSEATRKRYALGVWSNDNPHAIFDVNVIDKYRIPDLTKSERDNLLKRITVNIDPAITAHKDSDETGITVTGIDKDGEAYVLADHSGKWTPDQWATKAIELFREYKADLIVAEKNQGGLMVSQTIYAKFRGAPVKLVHATRGKEVRAEPIAVKYNEGKVHHVGRLDQLEDQMCAFGLPRQKSPDRMDSLVWGLSELFQIANTSRGSFKQTRNRVW